MKDLRQFGLKVVQCKGAMSKWTIPGALVQLKRLESERQKFSRAPKCPVPISEKIAQVFHRAVHAAPPPNNLPPAYFGCRNKVVDGIMCLWIFEKSI